ncbi:GDP-mannose:cellobiosyl-diphosphopolyprenol alpha-mannosyltransferase [Abditibacteriota bacterium]|nr:GDP-mannose:cellobiosyl-diphosphopolyprenol alpha-mannosyltransferase [Abditibacteriota bacterium]
MHVLHAHNEILASRGGIVAALAGLLPALRAQGVDTDLVSLTPRGESASNSPLHGPHLHLAHAIDIDPVFGFSTDLRPLMEQLARESSVIHSHGLWFFLHYMSYRVARENNKPHIISVHGMAQPYIQSRSRWKKAPIDWWFQDRALQRAHAIQALVPTEVEDIRRLGFSNPIALVPNGVTLDNAPAPARELLEEQFPALKNRRVLLFLGRLHPKKGLPHFLPAWKRAEMGKEEWHFLVAGPDEGGHRAELEAQVAALGLESEVTFAGLVTGELKRAVLHRAQGFVLPSHSEGFSISMLEASGVRLPILITPGCNFPEAVRAGAAIETPASEAGSLDALKRLLALSDDERRLMGEKGRALVERDYQWEVVAAKLKGVYEWCAGGGPKTDCIID